MSKKTGLPLASKKNSTEPRSAQHLAAMASTIFCISDDGSYSFLSSFSLQAQAPSKPSQLIIRVLTAVYTFPARNHTLKISSTFFISYKRPTFSSPSNYSKLVFDNSYKELNYRIPYPNPPAFGLNSKGNVRSFTITFQSTPG